MKGFVEETGFFMVEIILLLVFTGLTVKAMGAVFNPDKELVKFNTELLVQKINAACQGSKSETMGKFAFPQPSPSKLAGTTEFLAKFAIAGSKSADPHYVLYYEAFPVGEAVGWEVYHDFDTRIISPFDHTKYTKDFPGLEKLTYNETSKKGATISGEDADNFIEALKTHENKIIMEAASAGVQLDPKKKQILINNIILSDTLNVVPQEDPISPTKGLSQSASDKGNAGEFVVDTPEFKRFDFTDYLGISDEERTYIKYRVCGDNALCLKTRDAVQVYKLADACRGKYIQLFYDARGDTDSIVYAAIIGKSAVVKSKDAIEAAHRAEIAAQEAAKAADEAINAMKKYEPDIHAKSIERLKDLAKDADAATKAEFETALDSMQSATNNLADAKIAKSPTAIKLAEEQLEDAAKGMRAPLLKAGAPLADIDVRVGVLKEVSVLDRIKIKSISLADDAAKHLKALRTAVIALEKVAGKSKNIAKKLPKIVDWACKGVGVAVSIFTLGIGGGVAKGFCKVAVYGGVAAYLATKGADYMKHLLAFTLSFKVSDFYLASPCTIDGGNPSIVVEKADDCTIHERTEAPLCARIQKYPIYEYRSDPYGVKEIEHKGFHYTCMDTMSNNEDIPKSEKEVPCIRITVTEQKEGFCFTKNPYMVRSEQNLGIKTVSTAVNVFVDFFAPLWISLPTQFAGIEAPGGFNLDDLTTIMAAAGTLPVNELTHYLPESDSVALAPGELANSVGERLKEVLVDTPLGLSWSWPS